MNFVPRFFERAFLALRGVLPGRLAVFVGLALCLGNPLAARAQSRDQTGGQSGDQSGSGPQVAIEQVDVGFHDLYKAGEWTPLWITIRSRTDRTVRLVVDAPDPDDNLTQLPCPPVELRSGVAKRIECGFRTGRNKGELAVRIVDDSGATLVSERRRTRGDSRAELLEGMPLAVPLWVTLGGIDIAAGAAGASPAESPERDSASRADDAAHEPRVARLDSFEQLPRDWRLMQSIEVLILPSGARSGDQPLISQMPAEVDAVLRDWVGMGGHLLVSVGAEVEAYRASATAQWAPIIVEGQMPLRQLSSLEGFSGQHAPLRFTGTIQAARVKKLPAANVLLRDAASPSILAASAPYGFGRVTLLAVDIDRPPLSGWKALVPVIRKLAGAAPRGGQSPARKSNKLTHLGVTDLATQFVQTNEDFRAVRQSSYWSVLGWILLYLAIIGPLDFLFVHRVLRRPEWTWASLLCLVCAAVALAAWQARRGHAVTIQVNQFDLIDVDAETQGVRRHAWASLYSPEHRRFSVLIEPRDTEPGAGAPSAAAGPSVHLGWFAPPENSLGGLYHAAAANFAGRSYRFAPGGSAIENLPILQWSTKTVEADWSGTLSEPLIECSLESTGVGQLQGSIRHHLGAKLEDCMLVVAGWAYLPGEKATDEPSLLPNMDWRPMGRNVRQRDLKALMTGEKRTRRNKDDSYSTEILTTTEPYDPLGRSRGQLLAMISFHEAAGGSEYTGLANAALRGLELSELMRLGRGVLIGRLPATQSRVVVDGAEADPAQASTWVRFVLPIRQTERAPDRSIPKAGDPETDRQFKMRNTQ